MEQLPKRGNGNTPAPASDLGATAGELISAGAQLLQIRTDRQLMVATQRPRDADAFVVLLKKEAAQAGEDFFYSIPFKDHKPDCPNKRTCNCPAELVEGPGVGLARSAIRLWGNCNVDVTLEQETEDAWFIGAWAVDFETNYTRHETKRVSKMKVVKGGRLAKASERELDVIYQIGASKVERDVIVRFLPKYAIDGAFELAKLAALQEKAPVKEQIARLVRRFAEINVSLSQIEEYLGCEFTEVAIAKENKVGKSTKETLANLRGLITALKGGETEVSEVFGTVQVGTPLATTTTTGEVKQDDRSDDQKQAEQGRAILGMTDEDWEELKTAKGSDWAAIAAEMNRRVSLRDVREETGKK